MQAKTVTEEWTFEALSAGLLELPAAERRAAQSLLGLAVGDAAGLPFELRRGAKARARFHKLRSEVTRRDLARDLVEKRCERIGEHSAVFTRTYSDDTTCCDLKMEAACQAGRLEADAENSLQLALLQQYLTWAHATKFQDKVGRHGALFQGTGGFTQDFLVPFYRGRKNPVAQAFGVDPLFETHPVMGPFWPTVKYAQFAVDYFKGYYGFPSWGNGAVMSFAPHPVLAGRWRRGGAAGAISEAAGVLSKSHQEPTAALATAVFWELLDSIYSGAVGSTSELRRAVASLPKAMDLALLDHDCVPVAAFQEWLEHGDCTPETAEAFLAKLTKSAEGREVQAGPHGVFGELLHICADWNDDHKTCLMRSKHEPVLFSQRGLNSLLIAIWAASDAISPWQVLDRVIYVGGDTDTVGAVAGQLACPLLKPQEVVQAFVEFVALGPCPEAGPAKVANAAARRYFRRALLFAAGNLEELREVPSLLDPRYGALTAELTKKAILDGVEDL